MSTNPFLEALDAQDGAVEVLQALGYQYLPPEEAKALRGERLGRVVLRDVLLDALDRINEIEYRGERARFSTSNLQAAADAIERPPDRGVVHTNEAVYDLLTLGKSFEQTVGGDRKSFTVRYIDWDRPERNVYHVTTEFAVRGPDGSVRRADVVAFVNGLPFLVMECKRRDDDKAIGKAVADVWDRNEEMPQLMWYCQLACAGTGHELKYATAATPPPFFAPWREGDLDLTPDVEAALGHAASGQDVALWALARPERLLELTRHFVLFEAGAKKIARHQQYFAVKDTVARIRQREAHGEEGCGGIVWHTQGSGKSLTMVFLFQALSRIHAGARVVLATDRVNLDDQIEGVFERVGLSPVRASDGAHLARLLADSRARVITTVIDKFLAAFEHGDPGTDGEGLYVLVDEAHRSQFGRKHARMRRALPKACFIGFTGTPIVQKQKNVLDKFGPFLHRYTLHDALEDETVVPLLYESRLPQLSINKTMLDRHHDRVMEGASEYQVAAAQKWASQKRRLYESEGVIEEIATHIADHWREHWRGTGFKAQLCVPLRETAVRYQQAFQHEAGVAKEDRIRAAVVISKKGEAEADEELGQPDAPLVEEFWDHVLDDYRTADAYENEVVGSFKHDPEGVEILIVVGKLLTGFDAPRNTVLYVAKPLAGSTLLQAIARVNRVYPGKDFGYIVDYYGILGNLDEALAEYEALAGYDEADLADTLRDVRAEVDELPDVHGALLAVFDRADVDLDDRSRGTVEELGRFLGDEARRHTFYDRLSAFARTLALARSSLYFYKTERLAKREETYRQDLAFFQSLRQHVRDRYGERVDHREFQPRLRRLLDRFVHVEEVTPLTDRAVNIFDPEAFLEEVERVGHTPASKADTIANQARRVLTLRMDEDPARYRQFSEALEEAIRAFQERRLKAEEYLKKVRSLYDELVHGSQSVPAVLSGHPAAKPYFNALAQAVAKTTKHESGDELPAEWREALAYASIEAEHIIQEKTVVDWQRNPAAEAAIVGAVEDHLFDFRDEQVVPLSFHAIDLFLKDAIKHAKRTGA